MLEVRKIALEAATAAKKPMEEVRKRRAEMGDQIERALMSMVLNLGEASRRIGKDRTNRFRFASGSAQEALDAFELSVAWGWVREEQAKPVVILLDRVLAMTWRLEHPRKKSRHVESPRGSD